jgi:N-acetylneuraminic acid mutarotase
MEEDCDHGDSKTSVATPQSRPLSERKRGLLVFACAGIPRIGADSPAGLMASDPMLMAYFATEILHLCECTQILAFGGYNAPGNATYEIYSIAENTWRSGSVVSEVRSEHGSCTVDGRVYFVGGNVDRMASTRVSCFDLGKGLWSPALPLPTTRTRPGVVAIGHRIYALGGHTGGGKGFLSSYLVLDTDEGAEAVWREGSPCMPTERYDMGIAVIGKRLYAIGGYNTGQVNANEVLDTETGVWQRLCPMPTARQGLFVGVMGETIWCFGGYLNGKDLDVVEVYDIRTNSWAVSQIKVPTTLYSGKAIQVAERLYVVGGRKDTAFPGTSSVRMFDFSTETWTDLAPLSARRMWHDVAGF